MAAMENELKKLIIDTLELEDIKAEDIDSRDALFNGGLGLDSIDALEIALAVSKHYGFQLRSDNPDNRQIWSSFVLMNKKRFL